MQLAGCTPHYFHRGCIASALAQSLRCPVCVRPAGPQLGTQPPGTMAVRTIEVRMPGFPCSQAIVITYNFPSYVDRAGAARTGQRRRISRKRKMNRATPHARRLLVLLQGHAGQGAPQPWYGLLWHPPRGLPADDCRGRARPGAPAACVGPAPRLYRRHLGDHRNVQHGRLERHPPQGTPCARSLRAHGAHPIRCTRSHAPAHVHTVPAL